MSIPGSALPLLLASPAGAAVAENRSLRFNPSDSAYLSRTPSSSSNRRTFTTSMWVKRCGLVNCGVSGQELFRAGNSALSAMNFAPSDGPCDSLSFKADQGGVSPGSATNAVFRDFSAWMHIVYRIDTTQSTAANRVRVYVNNVEQTWHTTNYPSQNQELKFNQSGQPHYIGGLEYLNGYLAQFAHVDGSSLAPTSFAEYDSNNVWVPLADLTGLSYGANGFLLTFADNSSASALGTDTSGNGNDWTVNNISVTAGAGNDSMADSPFNGDTANDTGAGGEVPGNYCTWNPLAKSSGVTVQNGNLDAVSSTATQILLSTFFVSSGKWYAEFQRTSNSVEDALGIATSDYVFNNSFYSAKKIAAYYGGNLVTTSFGSAVFPSWSTGDIVRIKLDLDNQKFAVAVNGGSFSEITITDYNGHFAGESWCFCVQNGASGGSGSFNYSANFGQRAFAYSAPSGFKALCTANLDTPTIEDGSTVMDAVLYDGNGSTQTISGLNFSPDLVWLKSRSDGEDHSLQDTVRGAGNNRLRSNSIGAENTQSGQISSFNSDGWTMGNRTNESGQTYVGWAWDAGSSTVSNTSGSITSTVRANTSAGFSVLTYTGTGSNATVGHGLGIAPQFIVIKDRDAGTDWMVYHESLGNGKYLNLNLTAAAVTAVHWQNTSPTSSVFSIGTSIYLNNSDNHYVAYCFAPVEGYSAFGSYTGNGSNDGPFVYTGFRPKFLLFKPSTIVEQWNIRDSARDTYNPAGSRLFPNLNNAESTSNNIDLLSNGFKVRGNSNQENASGETYVWAAFAESPFAYARAR